MFDELLGIVENKPVVDDTYSVTLKGFLSKEEAQSFLDWYSHSGEQASGYWFEERRFEGEKVRSWIALDSRRKADYSEETKTLTGYIEYSGPEEDEESNDESDD